MKYGIKDVAKHAGVSTATVSRALNSPHLVHPETRQAIESAIEVLQFRPNLVGRQLRTTKTGLIGVMLPTLSNPVFADCLQGIEEAAAKLNLRILVVTTQYEQEREAQLLEMLLDQRVDGLVLTVGQADANPTLDRLRASAMPYTLVYNHSREHPSVTVANRLAAREAVSHLIQAGHQRVVMLSGALNTSDRAIQRYAGYCDAMREANLPTHEAIEVNFNTQALPAGLLDQFSHPDTRPSALFCGNDHLAIVAMHHLARLGLRIPDDVSVMGFDGLSIGKLLSPSLATVAQPNAAIGSYALNAVHAWLNGQPASGLQILPHELHPGDSVAKPQF